jgi:two-component sensor histidine kinase
MTSLLSLRAQATDNPSFREAMQECISQIRAISLIHERLYGIGNLSEIDFGEVICKITEELFHIYNTDNLQISPIVYSDKVLLTAYHAIPCAFILNELVSNSLKHAFPNKRSGEVCIELREKDGLVTLIVSDNGVGIPEDHDVMAGRSLGMKLTMTFIQQIQGTYKLDRSNGTKVIITFPKK